MTANNTLLPTKVLTARFTRVDWMCLQLIHGRWADIPDICKTADHQTIT